MRNNNLPPAVRGLTDQPHWRVLIRPSHYEEELIPSLTECRNIVRRTSVRLRGWDFPQIGRHENMQPGNNYIACAINFFGLEYWRFYQSGQFVHLHTLDELEQDSRRQLEEAAERHLGRFAEYHNQDWTQVPGFISIINFLYTVTEVFEFAARLCQAGVYGDECVIEIGLKHIQGFILMAEARRHWWKYCKATEDTLEHSWTLPTDVLVAESSEKALDAVEWFFERFGWEEPNMEGLRTEQREFLQLTAPRT